jgi:hypothetical protein
MPALNVASKHLFSHKSFAVIMSLTHAVTLTDDSHLMLKPIKMFCLCSRLVSFYLPKHKLLVRLRIITTIDKVYICIKN